SGLSQQYMVLVPFLIHTKVPEKICIQLTHLNESVTLSATLEYAGENRSLIADVVSEKDTFKCFSFTVPMSSSQKAAFLTVLVKGPTLTFRSRKSVLVKNSESLVFVQTDKPIYKPGQTVLFRIVSLDEDFHPLNEKVGLDPQRNRVYQWREVELSGGLTQLSFPLTSEPIQGPYKVVVQKESGTSVEHAFAVEEYVLPKYEVLVMVPKTITIQDEELKVAVCGLYTYGTPVPGLVNVHVCRKFSSSSSNCYGREADAVCEEFTRQADIRGCVSNVVQTKIFQLKRKGYEMEIEVQGKITEEGTGVELTGTGSTEITGTMSKIIFEQVDSHYRPGIPFFGQVKLVDGTDAPIANETIRISIDGNKYKANHTTNEEGRVRFSIDTANFTDSSIHITVNHKSELNCYDSEWVTPVYDRAVHRAPQFYSPSKSFLRIEPMSQTLRCGSTVMVQVHYILKPEAIEGQKQTVFYYLVMAKGGIARAGTEVHPVGDGEGELSCLRLPLGPDVAPLARLLVYITLPSGEVIASSEDFKIENCFANKVDLQFSPDEGLPASNTHLRVGASPGSLCAIRAVDKSVLLMKPEAELSPSSVYDLLPVKDLRDYIYQGHHFEEEDDNPCVTLDNIILNGFTYRPFSPDGEGDAYSVLKEMGLKVFTSTKVHKPRLCGVSWDHDRAMSHGIFASYGNSEKRAYNAMVEDLSHSPMETIRKYFPETWIWDLVTVKSVGSADLDVTIPDTITEWKANAFCTSSDTGFGLSPTVSLRAFQPFFVELTLPYSVVRGEAFTLKDTVVALQALSQYGVSTYAKSGGASTVTVRSTGDFKSEFQVDHMNRLLLQRVALPEVPGEYSTGVTGEGCVYVQTSLRYNVLPKLGEAPFVLQVHTVPEICDSSKAHRTFGIAINVSYTGKRPVSNMAIVDVKMLSGFIPVKTSLEGHHQIHRTEVSTNHVLLYMEQVSNMTQIFSFTVEQDFFVQSLKPALVKVYDYYETDEFAIAEYHAPCSKGSI
uniref:Alpha-2-macroglobulin n=1 Tax=Pelusios castaneus TaxID=367368 RepID=A0A8C8SRA6_9SAUR